MKFPTLKAKVLRKKAPIKDAKPQDAKTAQPPYTEEEARKVRQRLQGMGYIWHI
jgi:hypothetical protein